MYGSRSVCGFHSRDVSRTIDSKVGQRPRLSAMQYVAVFSAASRVDQPQMHDQGGQRGLPIQRRHQDSCVTLNALVGSAIVTIRQNVITYRRTTHWPVYQLGTGGIDKYLRDPHAETRPRQSKGLRVIGSQDRLFTKEARLLQRRKSRRQQMEEKTPWHTRPLTRTTTRSSQRLTT